MAPYVRIKGYVINLQNIAYIQIEETFIDFSFAFEGKHAGGPDYLRFEKGTDLTESEFEQVKDFVLDLPDPDRVIII
jgi:hypothetical protein